MLYRYAIALSLLIVLAGVGTDYLVTSSVHRELRDISSQLSALRQTTHITLPDHGQAQEAGLFSGTDRISDITPLISEAVRNTLQLHFSTADASCFYPSQSEHRVTSIQSETRQHPDIIRAGTEQADAILAAAIDMGIWEQESAQAFYVALHALPDAELAEAYRKLSQALNSGELQLPEEFDPTLLLTGSNFNFQ